MKPSESKIKNKVTKWARTIHRDLGFLMVGICLVYAISGILLNHLDGQDPAFKTVNATLQLEPGLDREELMVSWKDQKGLPPLRKILPAGDGQLRLMLEGGTGIYEKATGATGYEQYTKRQFVYWINQLHYNKVKGWSPMADLFAASLIFFALSGLVMVRGKKSLSGSGKWYLIAGLLIPVLYVLFA